MKKVLKLILALFIIVNIMAMFHAYKFTHFSTSVKQRTDANNIGFLDKIGMLFTGVSLPRPETKIVPKVPFTTIHLKSNVIIDAWQMQTARKSKGTIILFHGYGGEKSNMLDRAYVLLDMGYDVMLPDFMGASKSEGNQCTIGYKEAENVKTCVNYIQQKGIKNIYLLGTSMGAAAVMRAEYLEPLPVKGIILECPFGTMRQTVRNRFEMMHMPYFPLGDMLTFWGGVENGFNAFSHNPETYAGKIQAPTLLLFGEKDDRVKRFEIENIYRNLPCIKTLKTFPLSGHESYLNDYKNEWMETVEKFLDVCK
ncbi:alpha/beta hydrolase [Taibaiella lutea]|uniref:Alpha/beta hydrolase n=1 Tax=Taibaiella lutea TaxID=2608001 RepID=A0A5M6CHI4_9BACT|nr:alpha/beta fold hydrolase [Taibaiella lutea]KAA5532609.1 alpha/beta hydrolase [Taibaiella lutea]